MTTSDRARPLAGDGPTTAETARRLGIRYQHAYNILHNSGADKSNRRIGARQVGLLAIYAQRRH